MGRFLRKDGYDRVDVCDRISKLNGKYAFMAEKIKIWDTLISLTISLNFET